MSLGMVMAGGAVDPTMIEGTIMQGMTGGTVTLVGDGAVEEMAMATVDGVVMVALGMLEIVGVTAVLGAAIMMMGSRMQVLMVGLPPVELVMVAGVVEIKTTAKNWTQQPVVAGAAAQGVEKRLGTRVDGATAV